MTAHTGRGARTRPAGAAAAAAALPALASCAGGSTTDTGAGSAGGEGLPAGVTKEESVAAFEPIELYAQAPAPKCAARDLNTENFLTRIEDWSGGKITFDITYANAVAGATEIDDALADGRLDIDSVLMHYEPSDYPVTNALINAGIRNDGSPVVWMPQSNAWATPRRVRLRRDVRRRRGGLAFSKGRWETLPLVAQQLIWGSTSAYSRRTSRPRHGRPWPRSRPRHRPTTGRSPVGRTSVGGAGRDERGGPR